MNPMKPYMYEKEYMTYDCTMALSKYLARYIVGLYGISLPISPY